MKGDYTTTLATAGGNLFVFPCVLFPLKYCLAGEIEVPASFFLVERVGVWCSTSPEEVQGSQVPRSRESFRARDQ